MPKGKQKPKPQAGAKDKSFNGKGLRDDKDRITLTKLQIFGELDGHINQMAGKDQEFKQALELILDVTRRDLVRLGKEHFSKRQIEYTSPKKEEKANDVPPKA